MNEQTDKEVERSNELPYLLVAGAGALGGVVGLAYVACVTWLEGHLGPGAHGGLVHVAVMVAIGLLVGLIEHWVGSAGDVELLVDNIHVLGGARGRRELRSLIPVSLLCIASGGAAGPEAPLVQTTGSLGTWIAERRGLSVVQMRILTITGMAAGFTVLFGAPLGAAVFALEILHRKGLEYYEALVPSLVGAVCGYAVFALGRMAHLEPVWHFPAEYLLAPIDLGWAVLVGIAGTVVAWGFVALTHALRKIFEQLPRPMRPMAGGLVLGLLGLWTPYALTYGEVQVESLAASPVLWGVLATAALGKFLGTSVTVSSGWRGGFIIPLFFLGVCGGRLLHLAVPGTNEVVLMGALMAAINTGVTKTPLGSTLVVTAMSGVHLLPTTLTAALTTLLLSGRISLISSQRPRAEMNGAMPAMAPSTL
ncbi:MAG: chloride channel protein [Chrysiogenetes bacterium]|nr:chloride channel protein [Chrysiogenetes bacterium]